MIDRLLAELSLLLITGILAWMAMSLNMENNALRLENNRLELRVARVDRAAPWIKILTEKEREDLSLRAEQKRQGKREF